MLTLWPTFNFNQLWIKFFIDCLYYMVRDLRFDLSTVVKLTLKIKFQLSKENFLSSLAPYLWKILHNFCFLVQSL